MADLANEYANDPQMRAVAIGLEAEHFVTHTMLGRHLIDRAEQMRQQALEDLAVADPLDSQKIHDLQVKAKIPGLFIEWINEAVANGRAEEENIAIEEAYGK